MKLIAFVYLALASVSAAPALAATLPSGEVIISQAAVNAGNITPGDTPGFPVTISVPGSYRLTSNLTVTTTANGIEVRANEVTIDMGGFTLAGSGVGRNGIASFNRSMKVEHGTVRGFTNDGVRSIAQFLTVSDMVITANGRNGVFADFSGGIDAGAVSFARVVDSNVSANNGYGVSCGRHCHVEGSMVSSNVLVGIYFAGRSAMALGNSVTDNGGHGILFGSFGGAGNNTVAANLGFSISGNYLPMQPNACSPGCPPPT
jgi:hypothetical protein